ncbi:MAG: hypothetical protein N2109_03055 [Fimbriimonadales bacterium]|nr:hypothetical protein [Fimbriimonadales bacterium]
MSNGYHIVVCGSLVPDPLQTLEPVMAPDGPGLKNEAMLPSVLDPWAAHALYEAAHLAKRVPDSKVWLASLGPKPKLQQLMMAVAQKAPFEFVAIDGSASGFADSFETAQALAKAIQSIPGLDRDRMLLFGGCSSASRDAGTTLSMVGALLGVEDQFLAVDEIEPDADGGFRVKERVEGAQYLVSRCAGAPAVLAWATGNLPEPPNNPQIGMANMRGILPALAKAPSVGALRGGLRFESVETPSQRRETRVVKDAGVEEIARELAEWIRG